MTEPTKVGRPWSAEEEALLIQHTEQGIPRVESARRFGRTHSGVLRKAHKMRLGRPAVGSKGTVWTPDRLRVAHKLVEAGVTYRAIVKQFGGGSIGALHTALARLKKRNEQRIPDP